MSSAATKDVETLEAYARRTLGERRRELMARRQADEAGANELLLQREPDWEDQAASEAAAARLESLADNERMQLALVIAALERLDAGRWGRCMACGQAIDEHRLRAVPEAVRCNHCTNHH